MPVPEVKVTIIQVPASKISPNPWNPNQQTPRVYQTLKHDIEKYGFNDPLTVRELNGGKFQIIDGEHRWRIGKELGMKSFPVNNLGLVPDSVAQRLTLIYIEAKGEPDTMRLAEVVSELLKEVPMEELAADLPYEPDQLKNLQELVEFDFDNFDNVSQEEFPEGAPNVASPVDTFTFKVPREKKAMVEGVLRAYNEDLAKLCEAAVRKTNVSIHSGGGGTPDTDDPGAATDGPSDDPPPVS